MLLAIIIGLIIPVESEESLKLVHADLFRRMQVKREIVQELSGCVKLTQGKTTIECDKAVQRIDAQIYELIGNVSIYDDAKQLYADTVFVFEAEGRQVASGNVVSITKNDSTFADHVTYYQDEDRAICIGNVKIIYPEEKTVITGNKVDNFRQDKIAEVTQSASLIQYDTLGVAQTQIVADTLKVSKDGDETEAMNNVIITKPKIKATCDFAKYSKDLNEIVLTGTPKIKHGMYNIAGDSLKLYLADSKLKEAFVLGNAKTSSPADTLLGGEWENELTGKSMQFFFLAEDLKRIIVEMQATSIYHLIEDDEYKGANKLSGDQIMVEFKESHVDKIIVKSDPDVAAGTYSPPSE